MGIRFLYITVFTIFLTSCINCLVIPSTSKNVEINKNLTNEEVVRSIREVIKDNPTISVRSKSQSSIISFFKPKITSENIELGEVELNNYNGVDMPIGYKALIIRRKDHIKIIVEGIGPYCMGISDEAVAQELARILSKKFAH